MDGYFRMICIIISQNLCSRVDIDQVNVFFVGLSFEDMAGYYSQNGKDRRYLAIVAYESCTHPLLFNLCAYPQGFVNCPFLFRPIAM